MHRSALPIVLAFLLVAEGCYHFRVTAPSPDPATEYQSRTVHSFFWGLIQESVPANDCASNALDEVTMTTNLGYSVISVVTLGIWMPMNVRWRCARQEAPDSSIFR